MRLVATSILTMNNLTRVVIQLALISAEHPVTHFVVLTITRIADYASSTSLKMLSWPLSFDRETRAHLLGIQARKGPNTQDQAGRLMAMSSTVETSEGPNTQETAESLMSLTSHVFAGARATDHPCGIFEKQLENHPAPAGVPAALKCGVVFTWPPQSPSSVTAHGTVMFDSSSSVEKHGHPVCFPRSLENNMVWPHKRKISSVFTTVGEADIPCHPQLLCLVTLSSDG